MKKIVFITGASSGIGAALAREYAQQGAVLGLLARRQTQLEALCAALPNADAHRLYAVDVNDHQALQRAAEDFLAHHGKAHVVIASAGISVGTLTGCEGDLAVFEQVVNTNLIATAASFAPFIAAMRETAVSEPCRLVGIASVAGIRGLPGAEAYSASKAAVISYCESLRVELKSSGIRVVTIAPGYIDTPMTQINTYPMPFLMPVEKFARQAVRTIEAGRSYRVIPWQMAWVARLLRLLPDWLYDAVLMRAPHKARAGERKSDGAKR